MPPQRQTTLGPEATLIQPSESPQTPIETVPEVEASQSTPESAGITALPEISPQNEAESKPGVSVAPLPENIQPQAISVEAPKDPNIDQMAQKAEAVGAEAAAKLHKVGAESDPADFFEKWASLDELDDQALGIKEDTLGG